MVRKEIKKIDLIPSWLRETIAGFDITSVQGEFTLIRPKAMGDESSKLIVSLDMDQATQGGEVSLYWDGTLPVGAETEFRQKFDSYAEAEAKYSNISEELNKIQAIKVNPESAKKKLEEYLSELRPEGMPSDSDPHSVGPRTNSSLAKGWDVIEKEGKLLVAFSNEFLSKLLNQFKKANSAPAQAAQSIYSTGTRQHCGEDNFVISYWGKVQTSDGNIIRKAILIDRLGGEKHFVTGVSPEVYNRLCSFLTPDAVQYGIEYDGMTDQWIQKEAASIMTFKAEGEELDKILEYLGAGKAPPATKAEELKSKPVDDEKESIPFDEGQEAETTGLPEGGAGEVATDDKALDDLLKGL